jgi:hypothetical protein
MKYFLYIVGILVLLVFQAGVLVPIGIRDAGNLVLVFTILAVIHEEFTFSLIAALITGLVLDFVSGTIDGTMIICTLAVLGFTNLLIYRFIPKEQTWLILLIIISANTILFSLVLVAFGNIFAKLNLNSALDISYLLVSKLAMDLLINLVFTYPIYWFYRFILKTERLLSYKL